MQNPNCTGISFQHPLFLKSRLIHSKRMCCNCSSDASDQDSLYSVKNEKLKLTLQEKQKYWRCNDLFSFAEIKPLFACTIFIVVPFLKKNSLTSFLPIIAFICLGFFLLNLYTVQILSLHPSYDLTLMEGRVIIGTAV